jgi:hypothetical protein
MGIARQWHGKHISTETNMPAAIEELQEAVFSVQSMLRLCNEDQHYQSHDSQRCETVKHGHVSYRTWNEK